MISPVTGVESIREYLRRNLPMPKEKKSKKTECTEPFEHIKAEGHIVDEYA